MIQFIAVSLLIYVFWEMVGWFLGREQEHEDDKYIY